MPDRIILLDALRALDQGHLLRRIGALASGIHLENAPEAGLVFERLLREGLISEVEFEGRGDESLHFFRITEAGRVRRRQLQAWYDALPWYRRWLGRLGLPLPD